MLTTVVGLIGSFLSSSMNLVGAGVLSELSHHRDRSGGTVS